MNEPAVTHQSETQHPRWVIFLAAAIAVLHIYFNSYATLSELRMSLLHFGTLGLLAALTLSKGKQSVGPVSKTVHAALGLIALAASLYLILGEDAFYKRGQNFSTLDWVFSIIAICSVLELARRTTGWVIPILAVIAITYTAWWGRFVPGVFQFPGLSWETVLYRATYGGDGMFGTIARISWSYVFMFILFGTFLLKSGASEVILMLARAAAGRVTGGPGFVAVFGSGLMGSVSGSAIGNTVSTGVVTIPLMKRAGFPARTAAGIEAASSTGGQLMPPVMGAGAFLMATYTGESYLTIISVAAIPALLYFLSVAFHVRVAALKAGLQPQPLDSENSDTGLRRGWPVLIPLVVLVGCLVSGFTPTLSAGAAIVASIICAQFGPRAMGFIEVIDALAEASLTAASIAILLIGVGLIVMAVTTTGLGPTVSQMIVSWSGGSLLLTLTLVALASLFLGLGLPVTAAYVVLAPLAAPALADLILNAKLVDALATGTLSESARTILTVVLPDQAQQLTSPMSRDAAIVFLSAIPPELIGTISEQGLPATTLSAALISAHMIVFWLSQDSNVTPPVCLTAYAAAGLAGTQPFQTGLTAWAYAKGLYLIPVVMALSPLIGGTGLELIQVTLFTLAALYAFTGTVRGYLEGQIGIALRVACGALAIALVWPHGSWTIGGLCILMLISLTFVTRRPH